MVKDEYVIAVRTYARSSIFPQKTYRMLEHNGLTDRLYIFVADAAEKARYEAALAGKSYRKIIVGQLGGANAIRAICQYFPKGQRIVFMDDDLDRFFEFSRTHEFTKDSTKLAKYLEDGFATMDEHKCGSFTFSFMSNKMWLGDKPFKEFRPFMVAGNFFGVRNDPKMITTKYSHGDDIQRTVRYIDRYGGTLVYWWAGFSTNYGKEAGGLQASGDRGSAESASNRLRKTGEISWLTYNADPLLQAYGKPPAQEKSNPFVTVKLKALPGLRVAMRERGVLRDGLAWPTWFGRKMERVLVQ